MTLYELLEDDQQNGYISTVTNKNTPQGASSGDQPQGSSTPAPNASATNTTITNPIAPPIVNTNQYAAGSQLEIPMGPNGQKTMMKVTTNNNGNISLSNPQRPNDPAITYQSTMLDQLLGGNNG
jgi:hypothetical protein